MSTNSSHSFTLADYDLPVLTFWVTIHSCWDNPADTQGRRGNHASIYLVTSAEELSRIHMANKNLEDSDMGLLRVKYCRYITPRSALAYFDLQAVFALTVGRVVSPIYKNGKGIYKISCGLECRYWRQAPILMDSSVVNLPKPQSHLST